MPPRAVGAAGPCSSTRTSSTALSSSAMMYGFDYYWWSGWSEQHGRAHRARFARHLRRRLRLQEHRATAQGLAAARPLRARRRARRAGLDPVILGPGVLYLLVQTFLSGGLVSACSAASGATEAARAAPRLRVLLRTLLRLGLLALAAAGSCSRSTLRSRRGRPQAHEAVSGRSAVLLTSGATRCCSWAAVPAHGLCTRKVHAGREERCRSCPTCRASPSVPGGSRCLRPVPGHRAAGRRAPRSLRAPGFPGWGGRQQYQPAGARAGEAFVAGRSGSGCPCWPRRSSCSGSGRVIASRASTLPPSAGRSVSSQPA